MIHIKFYDYSGIDVSGLASGDLFVVRGILLKYDTALPYTSGYFIRTRKQADIAKRADHTRRTVYRHLDAFRNDYIGVNTVYNWTQLDSMNTPANFGDLVVDCSANSRWISADGNYIICFSFPARSIV